MNMNRSTSTFARTCGHGEMNARGHATSEPATSGLHGLCYAKLRAMNGSSLLKLGRMGACSVVIHLDTLRFSPCVDRHTKRGLNKLSSLQKIQYFPTPKLE